MNNEGNLTWSKNPISYHQKVIDGFKKMRIKKIDKSYKTRQKKEEEKRRSFLTILFR